MSSNPKTQYVKVKPARVHIGPFGLHFYASRFLDAMELVDKNGLAGFSPVPYYLVCHSLELVLKSFLSAKGVPLKDLKKKSYGHNLESVLTSAEENGLSEFITITPEQRSELLNANEYYNGKGFEYMELPMVVEAFTGYKGMPNLAILRELAISLLKDLEQVWMDALNPTEPEQPSV